MPALDDLRCLALYEAGVGRHPIDRALLLAASGGGTQDAHDWSDLPLGVRDGRLMALRCGWFGARFDARVACPACKAMLALSLDLRAFADRRAPRAPPDHVVVAGARFRCPTSRDMAALAGMDDVGAAAQALLRRVALDGEPDGGWRDAARAAIDQALDEADPLAHVTVSTTCQACAHAWTTTLDIAATLWDELASRAGDVVHQVHRLASAYGWSERDILSMPAARRALYLGQIEA